MQIDTVVVGSLKTNCYIVTKNNKTIIIDPGDEGEKIINACQNKNVVGIILTHHHFDHVGALKELEDYFNLSCSLHVPGFNYEIIKTPGHTLDSLSYYFKDDKVLFSGDFLFFHTIGRTDLATGSEIDMKNSLIKISELPDDVTVYPGHGKKTTLGEEKIRFNQYF